MIKVKIPHLTWHKISHKQCPIMDQPYSLNNGLVIADEQLWLLYNGANYECLIHFTKDTDAAWFILSYGGEIIF